MSPPYFNNKKIPEFYYFSFQFPTNWKITCLLTACPVLQGCTTLLMTAHNWDRFAVLLPLPRVSHNQHSLWLILQGLAPSASNSASCILSSHAFNQVLFPMAIHVPCKHITMPGTPYYIFLDLDSRNLSVKGQFF